MAPSSFCSSSGVKCSRFRSRRVLVGLLVIPHFVQSLSLADLREAASRLERLSTTLGNYAQITYSEHSYRQNHRRTLALPMDHPRICHTNVTRQVASRGYGRRMMFLMFEFTSDSPELSHEELERQIAEFARELGEQPQPL